MRAARRAVVLAALVLSLVPLAPGRATVVASSVASPVAESRIGVVLMVVCGLSLKVALGAPVPWAGVAIASCGMGLLDAALEPDHADDPTPAPRPAPRPDPNAAPKP